MTKTTAKATIQRGLGSEERPLTKVLWERDSRTKIPAMLAEGNHDSCRKSIDFERYYDEDYAGKELQKVFLKSWIFAGREEDLPNVGDRMPFYLGSRSFLIIRCGEDEFKAFYNSCIHRGTKLCRSNENATSIKCPFHGWEWHIDGKLKRIPAHWDFTSVTKRNGSLRELKLERWGGCIFINADPDSVPLLEALGPVPEHFKEFQLENRYTAAGFRRLVPANWKIVQEAFMESYHVLTTHPAAVPYNGGSQTQYDIWKGAHSHVGRQIAPSAMPCIQAPPEATSLEAGYVYAQIMKAWFYPDAELPALDPEKEIRPQVSQWHRDQQRRYYGKDLDATPDAVILDSSLYFVFPNFTFWLSESIPFSYSFTPHPSDPNKSYFEVRLLMPWPEGLPRPPAAKLIEVGENEKIAERVPAFSFLGEVIDQDMANMPLVQEGLKSADPGACHSRLGDYQEMIIKHWHDVLDELMESK